jgi:hypothetical protein
MDVVANIRIVEDPVAFVLLSIALLTLANAAMRLGGIPIRFVPLSLIVGLLPLYVWKALGTSRRVLVDEAATPELYETLHDVGEMFESLSGMAIAASALYLLYRLKKISVRAGR